MDLVDSPIPAERIAARILVIRSQKVILDADLAALYGVTTRHLGQAVKRNAERFPPDFAFHLTPAEWGLLRSRIVISKGPGGRRHPPQAFTEHGTLMAAAVLNSPAAVAVSLQVVRAFVRIRQFLATHEELARRVSALERKSIAQETGLRALSDAFRQGQPAAARASKRRIGFESEEDPRGLRGESKPVGSKARRPPSRRVTRTRE